MSAQTKTANKNAIDTQITTNGNNEITGADLNPILKNMVDSYEDFIGSYTTVEIAALTGMTLRQRVFNTTDNDYEWYDGTRWVKEAHPKYKVWKGFLTQSGTNAPVATVLENNLGGTIVWTFDSTGSFRGTLSNAFTADKTFLFPSMDSGLVAGSEAVLAAGWISASLISVSNLQGDFTPVNDLGRGYLEIEVYY